MKQIQDVLNLHLPKDQTLSRICRTRSRTGIKLQLDFRGSNLADTAHMCQMI